MPSLFFPRKSPQYLLIIRLGRPEWQSVSSEEEKFIVPAGIQTPDCPTRSIIIYYILRLLVGYSLRNSIEKVQESELDFAVIQGEHKFFPW